jgi:hypothetical protein
MKRDLFPWVLALFWLALSAFVLNVIIEHAHHR